MTASTTAARLRDDENQRRSWLAARPDGVLRIDVDTMARQDDGRPHHALSTYVDTYWTPLVGPTSMTMFRRLATWVDLEGPGPVPLADLAASVGLTGGAKASTTSPHSVLIRSLDRLCRWRLCWIDDRDDRYRVSLWLPPLTFGSRARLPEVLQRTHPGPWSPTLDSSRSVDR